MTTPIVKQDATFTPHSLYQRIANVQKALESISATGHNQFSAKALSISDVENALRKPLADAGIVTRWSYVELAQIEKGLWRAHLKVTVCSTDIDSDLFEDDWVDIGGNPMAATSFARKGYLKALFHITEEGDEQGRTETKADPQRQAEPARTAIPSARIQPRDGNKDAGVCAQCQMAGYRSKSGGVPRYFPNARARSGFQCNGIDAEGDWQNHEPKPAEQPIAAAVAEVFGDGVPTPTDADR